MGTQKARGTDFERAVLSALIRSVREGYGGWGMGIRRRQPVRTNERSKKALTGLQICDLIFGSSVGGMVIECKSKTLPVGAKAGSSKAKLYVKQAIKQDETTRLLDLAFAWGFVPMFAFEFVNGGRGQMGREAFFLDAEHVLRYLIEYGGITLEDVARDGVRIEWMKLADRWGYGVRWADLARAMEEYRQALADRAFTETAVYEWCQRALDGRREGALEPSDAPNVARMLERVRHQNDIDWVLRGAKRDGGK